MRQLSAPATAGLRKSRFMERPFHSQALDLVHAGLHVSRKPVKQSVTVHKRPTLYMPL
jgi:hypothetical protein